MSTADSARHRRSSGRQARSRKEAVPNRRTWGSGRPGRLGRTASKTAPKHTHMVQHARLAAHSPAAIRAPIHWNRSSISRDRTPRPSSPESEL
jgi:hypothetical protein